MTWADCTIKINDIQIPTFQYLTSGGDPKATAAGQQTMTFAFAGIILMALAYVVFLIIKTFTGVDVLNFTIPAINYPP
jgi:hypothetical protein